MMRKPKHPPLTLEAIIAWLATQPPEQDYVWQDPTECVVGRYLRDHGSSWGTVAYSTLPDYDFVAGSKPWTFGAALERAKTLALPAPALAPTSTVGVTSIPAIAPTKMELLTDGTSAHLAQKDRAAISSDRPAQRQ